MKILVPVKRVVDYNVKIRVKGDGTRRRACQCQDVDEPVRRDRRRRGAPAEGKGSGDRDHLRVDRSAQATETIRTGLAMGADRGILVKTDSLVEPLAVAKILKAVIDAEQPGLVILGKQAIDDDCNQTGQMLAALTGWPQGTFASKLVIDGDSDAGDPRGRRRPADGEAQEPGDRHHRSAAQRAALCQPAQHHEGEEKADRREEAGGLLASTSRRGSKCSRPASRPAASPASRSRPSPSWSISSETRQGSCHDNTPRRRARQQDAQGCHQQGAHRRQSARRRRACAGRRQRCPRGRAKPPPSSMASPRCCWPTASLMSTLLAEPLAALVVSLASGYDAIVAPATTTGKNFMPRVAALLDVMQISDIVKVVAARHVRAPDLCRKRAADRCAPRRRSRSSRCAPRPSSRPATAARHGADRGRGAGCRSRRLFLRGRRTVEDPTARN